MMIFILTIFIFGRYAELEHFTSLPDKPIQAGNCDVVIQRPTIFMKLDAGKYYGSKLQTVFERNEGFQGRGKGFYLCLISCIMHALYTALNN